MLRKIFQKYSICTSTTTAETSRSFSTFFAEFGIACFRNPRSLEKSGGRELVLHLSTGSGGREEKNHWERKIEERAQGG